jgi:hypothetical protein
MTEPVYAIAYPIYRDRGWAPIKLKAHTKFPPPCGFTGHDGADPSGADMYAWAEEEPDGNIAIRLPADVIGIDVDAYDGKTGAATLAEAEKRWGRLPYSPRSTSRNGDHISGIRLYRIPAGVELVDRIEFPDLKIGDVEICQHHHRYVMCWPSIHAKTGRAYEWLGIDSTTLQPPYPADVPELPAAWLEALTKPAHHNNTDLGGEPPYNIREALTEGQPSRRVTAKLGQATIAAGGTSRYDHTRDNVLALLRYGKDGDGGVKPALIALKKAYVAAVGPDRPGGHQVASEEFDRFTFSDSVAQLLAKPSFDDWTHNLGEPPPDPDEHLGGEYTGEDDQPTDSIEGAVTHRMTVLRINREANRRLDDEEHPPIQPPPLTSLAELLTKPRTPTRYRIDKVAPENSRIILSAQYKAGKSTIIGNLLRALVDGDDFLGRFTVNTLARRAVLIDDELSENMLLDWLYAQGINNTAAISVVALRGKVAAFNLLDDRCRTEWITRLRELDADYLILDCLRPVLDAAGLDESRDTGKFLIAFDALLHEAAISDAAIVHHMGHTGERARGDSRLQDWPDAIWRLVREDDQPSSPRYFTAYGRDVDTPEGRLCFDPDTRRLTYAPGSRSDAKAEAAQRDVITLLAAIAKANPATARGPNPDCFSKNQIEGVLRGAGYGDHTEQGHSQRSVRAAIARAVARGLVAVKDGPRGAKLHHIANPCSECGMPVINGGERHLSCLSESEELFE